MDELIVKDPIGGVKGDDLKTTNPFSMDRKTALIDINLSIDWMEGRKRKSDKTVLQRMRDGNSFHRAFLMHKKLFVRN